jgi:chemotaxis protein histidine kinase CheA
LLRVLAQDVSEWRHERQRAASGAALLAARTLAETSGAIGFQSMRQLMLALDMALRGARARVAPAQALSPAQYDLLERVLQCGTEMLLDFALGELPAGQGELLVALQQLRTQLQSQQPLSPLAPPRDEPAQRRSAHDKLAHDEWIDDRPSPAPRAGARVALVRVRADILDRIATHAGAVSTSRLKLEGGVVTLRTALLDFSDNLGRLQRQLRDVEMQAEAQIASRMAIGKGGQFDALEFDRCARLQELTRIMAESVSEVAGVHRSLTQGVEIASCDLQQQAGLTLAMQGELERVRPLPVGGAARAERAVRFSRGARQARPGLGA